MAGRTYFVLGDYNAVCDVCGFQYKASQLRKRWDGAMVCDIDWEPRPAQDMIRAIKETTVLPFTRSVPTDTFVYVGDNASRALNTHALNNHSLG